MQAEVMHADVLCVIDVKLLSRLEEKGVQRGKTASLL